MHLSSYSCTDETELNIVAFIGIFLWWSGFLIEVVADNQKENSEKHLTQKLSSYQVVSGQDLVIQIILGDHALDWYGCIIFKFFIWN